MKTEVKVIAQKIDEERFSREVVRVDVFADRLEYEKQKLAG